MGRNRVSDYPAGDCFLAEHDHFNDTALRTDASDWSILADRIVSEI
jgi:hypothetical protein